MGGAEKVVLQIVSHLDPDRFVPTVVVPRQGIFSQELSRIGAKLEFIDLERLKKDCRLVIPLLSATCRIVRLLRHGRIDLLVANSLWTLKFGVLASLLARTPIIAHLHAYPKIKSTWKATIHRLTRRFCYTRTTKIVAVSNALKNALINDKAPPEKIVVIPNRIDQDWLADSVKLPSGPTKTVLTVGRLHPGKGQQVFLEAAALIKQRFPNVRFVIAGEEYKTSLEDLGFKQELVRLAERLGLQGAVEFVGYTDQLREIYKQASVVVVASFEETFGLTALEAMAAGRPVVASAIPGISELIQDNETGLLFKPGDSEDLAAKVCQLLSDDERAGALARRALLTVKARYDLKEGIEGLQEVYLAAMDES